MRPFRPSETKYDVALCTRERLPALAALLSAFVPASRPKSNLVSLKLGLVRDLPICDIHTMLAERFWWIRSFEFRVMAIEMKDERGRPSLQRLLGKSRTKKANALHRSQPESSVHFVSSASAILRENFFNMAGEPTFNLRLGSWERALSSSRRWKYAIASGSLGLAA
jgi:hypothetical protein